VKAATVAEEKSDRLWRERHSREKPSEISGFSENFWTGGGVEMLAFNVQLNGRANCAASHEHHDDQSAAEPGADTCFELSVNFGGCGESEQ